MIFEEKQKIYGSITWEIVHGGRAFLGGELKWWVEVWASKNQQGRMKDIYSRAMASTSRQKGLKNQRCKGSSLTNCPSLSGIQDFQV